MISRSAATSTLSAGMPEPAPHEYSRIDQQTNVDGTISTSDDLRVEGRVTGTVTCAGILYVAEGAEVDATVEAGGIVVAGTLSGNVRCNGRLEIRSTGVVRARVDTERLIIHEGAVYEGQLRMESPAASASSGTESIDERTIVEEPSADEVPPAPTAYSFLRSFTTPPPAERGSDVSESDDPDDEP